MVNGSTRTHWCAPRWPAANFDVKPRLLQWAWFARGVKLTDPASLLRDESRALAGQTMSVHDIDTDFTSESSDLFHVYRLVICFVLK